MVGQGNRLLILNDESPLFGGLVRHMRGTGAEILTAQKPAAGMWYVDGEPLDGIVAFLRRSGPDLLPFVTAVRRSRLNARTPVSLVADEVDAHTIKRLAALRVTGFVLAPGSAGEVWARLEPILAPPARRPSYDVRLINCFLLAARAILDFYLGPPLDTGRPAIKSDTKGAGFVTGLIAFGANGQFGSLSVTFERPFIDALASKVLGEAAGPLDDAAYADLAGEMCNQVLGKARQSLADLGIVTQMGLPEMVVGPGHSVLHKVDEPVIVVPLHRADAACVIEFTMDRRVAPEIRPAPGDPDATAASSVDLFDTSDAR